MNLMIQSYNNSWRWSVALSLHRLIKSDRHSRLIDERGTRTSEGVNPHSSSFLFFKEKFKKRFSLKINFVDKL